WLSEMMLMQTRTQTVVPYYERFLGLFPDVHALARAPQEQVLKAWEGLGYYSRARNLHRAANIVSGEMGGMFPQTAQALVKLPGVGPYAAAAIASIAFGEPVPALDANLVRVLSRVWYVEGEPAQPAVRARLHEAGTLLMLPDRPGDVNQALMDLGATVCLPTRPLCLACPVRAECLAFASGDPDRLPALKPKKAPRAVPVAVVILMCQGRALLVRRESALLRGLYTFPLAEGDAGAEAALETARAAASDANIVAELGEARHVFTHRVWEMRLYHAAAPQCAPVPGGVWANREEMEALPIPTAMKAAKSAALELMKERRPSQDTLSK
ncbi:MAG TPA: A/G-specific adenine glycosylase, partial [Candidatus Limnocylindria bacterium]|nr:A/G-specific adenine glycosylase [Candidatus Limnocylindria bacterium]